MVSKVAIINLTSERFPRVKIFDFLFKVEEEVSSEVNFVYCRRWMMSPVDHSMIRTFSGGTEWIWSTLKIFLRQRTDICRRKGEFLTQRKWLCVFCVLSTWVVLDDLDDIEATELAAAPGNLTWKSVSELRSNRRRVILNIWKLGVIEINIWVIEN